MKKWELVAHHHQRNEIHVRGDTMKKLVRVTRSFIEFDRGEGCLGVFGCVPHDKQRCVGCGKLTQVMFYDGGDKKNFHWKRNTGFICIECINALFADTYRSKCYEEDKFYV